MVRRLVSVLVVLLPLASGCGSSPDHVAGSSPPPNADPAADAGAIEVDEVEIVHGVPDHDRDPAVVAIDIGGSALCTGTLVSPQIVLTARHCVSETTHDVACPSSGSQIVGDRDPATLAILVGDDVAKAETVAHGADIVVPSSHELCDHDIALIVLDTAVEGVKPLPISSTGAARGDSVRAVGYGLRATNGARGGKKLLREHVKVLSVTGAELTVGEATCSGDSGGPALNEDTGEIVGVVSRGGPACQGPGVHNIYTRADAFATLIDEAFRRAGAAASPGRHGAHDGGSHAAPKGSKHKPPSDVGGPCAKGADCAAGICITGPDHQYCSRHCGGGDRCPAHYHCKSVKSSSGSATSACIAKK